MEIIQTSPKDFILNIRKELNDAADLRFESAAAGEVTVVYFSTIANQGEIENHFLKPLEQFRSSGGLVLRYTKLIFQYDVAHDKIKLETV